MHTNGLIYANIRKKTQTSIAFKNWTLRIERTLPSTDAKPLYLPERCFQKS